MKDLWLSVIMPCRNGERWLGDALQSIVDQGEEGIEVIFADSSESDASLRIAETFSNKLAIRIHTRPDLSSWTAKTNFAVAQAKGNYISMLHQDDLWLAKRCARLREWLSRQSDAVMYVHPAFVIDACGKKLGTWRCPLPAGEDPVPPQIMLERLLVQNFVPIPAAAIRREVFLEVGGMDEALWYTADWDLYLKLSGVGSVYYHPEPLASFRIHKSSQTMTGAKNLDDYRRQLEVVLDRHRRKLGPGSREAILRLSAVSIAINAALAAANNGRPFALFGAFASLLKLGPSGIYRYLYYSRIIERTLPRLRARLAGRF